MYALYSVIIFKKASEFRHYSIFVLYLRILSYTFNRHASLNGSSHCLGNNIKIFRFSGNFALTCTIFSGFILLICDLEFKMMTHHVQKLATLLPNLFLLGGFVMWMNLLALSKRQWESVRHEDCLKWDPIQFRKKSRTSCTVYLKQFKMEKQ